MHALEKTVLLALEREPEDGLLQYLRAVSLPIAHRASIPRLLLGRGALAYQRERAVEDEQSKLLGIAQGRGPVAYAERERLALRVSPSSYEKSVHPYTFQSPWFYGE